MLAISLSGSWRVLKVHSEKVRRGWRSSNVASCGSRQFQASPTYRQPAPSLPVPRRAESFPLGQDSARSLTLAK